MRCLTARQLIVHLLALMEKDELPAVEIGNGGTLWFFLEKGRLTVRVFDSLAGLNGRNYPVESVNGRKYDHSAWGPPVPPDHG